MASKKNKDILVYFGDTANDIELRNRIKKRCKYISESSFMKEAAEEKLNREEAFDKLSNIDNNMLSQIGQISSQQNTPQKDDDTMMNDVDIDTFLDSFD